MTDDLQHVGNDGSPGTTDAIPSASTPDIDAGEYDPAELLERVTGWWRANRDHIHEWRQEAAECFDFAAGRQWDEEALDVLRDQNRPAITIDRVGAFIDAVSGMEINTRQETSYKPRQVGFSGGTDLLTEAAKWVRDECDAEDEESAAFRDVVVCGMGCTQTRLSYDDDPDGEIIIERVSPLEIYPDAGARKDNYADARNILRVKDIPLDAAREMFPDFDDSDLHAQWAEDEGGDAQSPHNARLAPYYRVDQSGEIDRDAQMVRLVEAEWFDYAPAYRVMNPDTGKWVRMDKDAMTVLEIRSRAMGLPPFKRIEDRKKIYHKAIFGAVLLKKIDGAEEGGFSYKFITGKRDENKGVFYGMMRAMRDPQRWANKFFSQALHILNTNAKGGLLAEADAFEDIEEARDTWAEADAITVLAPGGIGKILPKNPPAFPAQLNQMLEYAVAAIPQVNGLNLEIMGQSSSAGQQVAAVEAGRRAQAMNLLAGLFNAKRRYQKEQGRLMLWMIRTFISDGRLIRIGGPENAQYVPLIHQQGADEYDVIVDDAPTSPNMKDKTWGALMQLLPLLRGVNIPPTAYAGFMKYAPVPASLATELQKAMSQPPPPDQGAQGKQALDQATAQLRQAQAAHTTAEAQAMPTRMQLEMQDAAATIDLKRAQTINQYQNAGLGTMQAMHDANEASHAREMDMAQLALQAHQQGHDNMLQHMQGAQSQANIEAQPPEAPNAVG